MADLADVYRALAARLSVLDTGSPDLPIAWPESVEAFNPPAEGGYLEVQFLPNQPRWQAVGPGKLDQGLFQVTVVWPKNKGITAPYDIADLVKAHFVKGDRYGPAKITADPYAVAPLTEGNELRLPVTVPWVA